MRHLRALVALSEELNFTRTAQRLHLTQQALSGQIRQLEERVGVRLVERDSRRVELTAAGSTLCEQARPLLASAEHAVAAARAAGGDAPSLSIGYIAPLTRRLVAPAVERFTAAHPEIELTIHFATFLSARRAARARGRRRDPLRRLGHDGIELTRLFSEPRGVALAADHPLAHQPSVALEDFLREPLVLVPTADHRWHEFWTAGEHRRGRPPQIGATARTLDALIEAVGAGLGVVISVPSVIEALGPAAGVVFRPVPGLSPLDFWVARGEGDDREYVLDFVKQSVAALQQREPE